MKWAFKWRKELKSGQYYDLLNRGFIKPEQAEPNITGLDFYYDAFRELSSARPSGLDLQAIPFTAIVEYSRIYELDDFDHFYRIMRLMDDNFLELHSEASKAEGKNASTNSNKANNNKGRFPGQPKNTRNRKQNGTPK